MTDEHSAGGAGEASGCGCATFLGVGGSLAVVISWGENHSILWATLHGFLGWFYVGYYVLVVCRGSCPW